MLNTQLTRCTSFFQTQTRSYHIYEEISQRWKSKSHEKVKFPLKYKTVKLQYGIQARSSLIKGIERLAKAASLTLGPGVSFIDQIIQSKGRNVALEYEGRDPKITKDGVTVVKSVFEPIREQDMGARLLKRVAGNTNLFAGDGTTTSTLISKELLEKGFFMVENGGIHPIGMKKGMDKSLQVVLKFLKDMSMPVSTQQEIYNICKISSNYDETISRIISQTMTTIGPDGVVNIIESPTGETKFNLVNGLIFERGYVSEAFVTEHKVEQKCELEFPLVLVVTNKIKEVKDIVHILDLVKKTKRSFVLFSEDLQEDPMSTMIYNNLKDIINCCAVNVPWMGDVHKDILQDIATQTGATLIDNDMNIKIQDLEYKHFGSAKKIAIDSQTTHIVGRSGTKEQIDERILKIQEQIALEPKANMKKIHKERIARMQAKIGEIEVGGRTEALKGEVRDLIVDALNSAKSAMQAGMLPGGGIALYQASKLLEKGLPEIAHDEHEAMGAKILSQALKKPLKQLIENKTGQNSGYIIQKIEEQDNFFYGFDVKNERLCDMIDEGIVDSYNVIKVILQDSVSLAGMLMTTECLVIKEKTYEPLPLQHYQDKREFF